MTRTDEQIGAFPVGHDPDQESALQTYELERTETETGWNTAYFRVAAPSLEEAKRLVDTGEIDADDYKNWGSENVSVGRAMTRQDVDALHASPPEMGDGQWPDERDVLKMLENRFGPALNNDDEINGGDMVEWIANWWENHVRPTLDPHERIGPDPDWTPDGHGAVVWVSEEEAERNLDSNIPPADDMGRPGFYWLGPDFPMGPYATANEAKAHGPNDYQRVEGS